MGVATCLATPAAFAETTFTPEELERSAFVSLQEGDPVRALAFADALLLRDETDVTPHLLRARALRDMGRLDDARDAARMAWKLSGSQEEKFSSALIMAQVLSTAEKRTRAQLWLRRAVQHAPNPQLAYRAKRDFKYVQQRNPWQTHLSFTLAPNSNINNGSIRETLGVVFYEPFSNSYVEPDLLGSSRALSGFEYGATVQSRFRFTQTATEAHDLITAVSYRTYTLSSEARRILRDELTNDIDEENDDDPIATGSDFAYGSVSVGYRFNKINFENKGELAATVRLGQSWYGGNRLASFLRGDVSQTFRPDRDRKLTLGLRAEIQDGQMTTDTERLEVFTSLDKRLASGNNLYLGASIAAQTADTETVEYAELELSSGLTLAKPIMGAALQFGLAASLRDYDVSQFDASGREDLRISADVTAVFREIDYYGFNPSVTLSASSTVSNINLYDSNRFGLSFGIRSAF